MASEPTPPRHACWSHPERALLVRAMALLWVVGLAVRVGRFSVLMSLLLRQRGRHLPPCSLDRLTEIVYVAATWCWPRPTCLTRALVLGRLLIACGQDAHVVLGVDRRHGGFAAHAWVECGGRALGHDPGGALRFETICRITRDGAVVTGAAS